MQLIQEYRIVSISTEIHNRHRFVLQIVGENNLLFHGKKSTLSLTDDDCQRFGLTTLSQLEGRRLKCTFDLHQTQPNSFLSAFFTEIDRTTDYVLIDAIEHLEVWSPNNEQLHKVSYQLHLISDDGDDLYTPTFDLIVELTPDESDGCTKLAPQSAFEVNLSLLPMKSAELLQRELMLGWAILPNRAPK